MDGAGQRLLYPQPMRIRDNPTAFCFLQAVLCGNSRKTEPVTACTENVADGMNVTLQSPRINRLRKSSFDLLMSNHRLDCAHCDKNKKCDLQKIAQLQHFRLTNRHAQERLTSIFRWTPAIPLFSLDRNKCVLCGKCIWVCQQGGKACWISPYRGINTVVSTFAGMPLAETACNSCLACVAVCPVGALYLKQPQLKVINV